MSGTEKVSRSSQPEPKADQVSGVEVGRAGKGEGLEEVDGEGREEGEKPLMRHRRIVGEVAAEERIRSVWNFMLVRWCVVSCGLGAWNMWRKERERDGLGDRY